MGGGEERLARTPQNPHRELPPIPHLRQKVADKCGLANPGLAADECDMPMTHTQLTQQRM